MKYISVVIHNNWLMQESPGLKPDWLEEISSLSIKNSFSYKLVDLVSCYK